MFALPPSMGTGNSMGSTPIPEVIIQMAQCLIHRATPAGFPEGSQHQQPFGVGIQIDSKIEGVHCAVAPQVGSRPVSAGRFQKKTCYIIQNKFMYIIVLRKAQHCNIKPANIFQRVGRSHDEALLHKLWSCSQNAVPIKIKVCEEVTKPDHDQMLNKHSLPRVGLAHALQYFEFLYFCLDGTQTIMMHYKFNGISG